jgi:hypothetical protein
MGYPEKIVRGKTPECDLVIKIYPHKIEIETMILLYDGGLYDESNPPSIVTKISKCKGVKEDSVSIDKTLIDVSKEDGAVWDDVIKRISDVIEDHIMVPRLLQLDCEYQN